MENQRQIMGGRPKRLTPVQILHRKISVTEIKEGREVGGWEPEFERVKQRAQRRLVGQEVESKQRRKIVGIGGGNSPPRVGNWPNKTPLFVAHERNANRGRCN